MSNAMFALRWIVVCLVGLLVSSVSYGAPVYYPDLGQSYELLPVGTWPEAEGEAVSRGGHLVSIGTEQEQVFVRNTFGGGWIGLNDIAQEGTFVWSDGSPVTYLRWRSGEPNNAGGGEDWGELESGGDWNDLGSPSVNPGIAKYDGAKGVVNPANGHTYYVLSPMEWHDAQAAARQLGGHLASISDQAENDFVHALWPGFKWIGLTDETQEGAFRWTDGSPTTYNGWFTDEPNDQGGEDYAAMFDAVGMPGAWNDTDATDGYFGIVEVGPVFADINGDDAVNIFDFGMLKDFFGNHAGCASCDLNGDAKVDLADYGLLKGNFGATKFPRGASQSVPEPSGFVLVAVGLCILALCYCNRLLQRLLHPQA